MARFGGWAKRLVWLAVGGVLTALVLFGILPNPLPPLWNWITRDAPLAEGMTWQERLPGRPTTAIVSDGRFAVDAGRRTQVREIHTGVLVLDAWKADWLTMAGTGTETVVIAGQAFDRGYQVRELVNGTTRVEDRHARAVWGFADARLDLRCDGPRSCELRAYPPAGDTPIWSVALPGVGSGLVGADPPLAGSVLDLPRRIGPHVVAPRPMPPLLGIPVDRRTVVVVHTGLGQVMAHLEADRDEMIVVVDQTVVRSLVTRRDGVCQLQVTGHDATGALVWGPEVHNLRTVTGGGCEQRIAPVGYGAALVAVGPDGREMVIDANDGRVLWHGAEGERIRGLTEHLAVVQGADPAVRYGVRLGGDGSPLWEHRVGPDAELVIADCGVVVADKDPNRIVVWDAVSGEQKISLLTSARVLACTGDGVLLSEGRSVGFRHFRGPPSPHEQPAPGPRQDERQEPPPVDLKSIGGLRAEV